MYVPRGPTASLPLSTCSQMTHLDLLHGLVPTLSLFLDIFERTKISLSDCNNFNISVHRTILLIT